jgi:hypothetical protein
MSHALTLAAGTRTKEYSSILDYDQRADQPPTSIQVSTGCLRGAVRPTGARPMGFVTKSDPYGFRH